MKAFPPFIRKKLLQLADWIDPEEDNDWRHKQEAASPSHFYGGTGTIHQTPYLHVETQGESVVAVWYRCRLLPYVQVEVEPDRAEDMERAYIDNPVPALTGIEILEDSRGSTT